jgi:hypothetical protein
MVHPDMSISFPYSYPSPPKPKKELLIEPDESYESLMAKRDDLIEQLQEVESKRYPTDSDNIDKNLILRKLQVLEAELLRLTMLSFETKLCRLLGLSS